MGTMKDDELVGQVVHRRRKSKKLCFLDVMSSEKRYCVVAKSERNGVATACGLEGVKLAIAVRAGDTVRVSGVWEDAATLLCDGRLEVADRWDHSTPFEPIPPPPSAKAPPASSPLPCKFWVNTGACTSGDGCRYVHDQSGRAAAGARWVAAKRDERRALRGQDDLAAHDESKNSSRHRVVAEFLLRTFGRDALSKAGPILDVAGGRGSLAFELQAVHGLEAILVEPRTFSAKGRLNRKQHKFLKRRGESAETSALVPEHIAAYADETFAIERAALVERSAALVGIHSDEATEWIVDTAIAHNKPFLVVPCCVFPSLFPERIHPLTAAPVVSHQDFVDYLLAKRYASGAAVVHENLPFAGRNQCIWGRPDA